ncbi:MAG: beta-ketoacyl-ACP synthase II [Chloroflexi bacterium]|nr:beta-ketoacyl-ACP synthase II [Chloroflexota bacterium]
MIASAPRRVVVTGIGAVTPLGNSMAATWQGLLAGRSGIGPITQFDTSGFAVRFAGEVKDFDPRGAINPKELRHLDRSTQFALVAAREAIAEAGLEITAENAERVGVVLGTGAGGIRLLLNQQRVLDERGPDRVSPMFLPYFLPDAASGVLAITLGAQGPNMAIASACSTGGHAVGEAFETIRRGDADVVIAGSTEAGILPVIFAGFINMRALSTRNEEPEAASRPFDRTRDGFVIAEGAAVMVLEELSCARARGAPIAAEVLGYGSGNDAFHMVAPRDWGAGAAKVVRAALRKAGIAPEQVDYINAHGTSTPLNDKYETQAIKAVFGDHARKLVVSSTKSMLGHMFGAAGAVEAAACVRAIQECCIPPTINYRYPDPECDLDYAPNEARARPVRVAISNSFGLGGHNSCLVFGAVDSRQSTVDS